MTLSRSSRQGQEGSSFDSLLRKKHEYLGMQIKFFENGSMTFSMLEYVKELLDKCPDKLFTRVATTPAASHLFEINDKATKLEKQDTVMFHHLVAKLLYLCKRTRPDIQLAVAFLTTRVKSPDVDDLKKLGRCVTYLKENPDNVLTLEADNLCKTNWWVDALLYEESHQGHHVVWQGFSN